MSTTSSNASSISLGSTPSIVELIHEFTVPFTQTPDSQKAFWEAIILDAQYALRLDSYIDRTKDTVLLELVNAFRAVDTVAFTTGPYGILPHSPITRYSVTKAKRALLNLLASRNFGDVVVKIEEEIAYNQPPVQATVVERTAECSAPTPPPERSNLIPTNLTSEEIDKLFAEHEEEQYRMMTSDELEELRAAIINDEVVANDPLPAPYKGKKKHEEEKSSKETRTPPWRKTNEEDKPSLEARLTTPPPGFTSTDDIPILSIGSPIIRDDTPVPVPPPTRRPRRSRRLNTERILALGLPTTRHVPGQDPTRQQILNDTHTRTTPQPYQCNFKCRVCHQYGHKQKQCERYFCRICGLFAPGHLTPFCPRLHGKKILRRGISSETFYTDMRQLEAAYDHDAARLEQDREENALEAMDILRDLDCDPSWYDNMDN